MPRLQPPPGYTTSADAARRLGVSDSLLSRYVEKGKLGRYGPAERKHKFYKLSEIEALLATERTFPYATGQWHHNPASTFDLATEEDMPAIVEISRRIFGDPVIPVETRLTWLRKNPETFHVLRNQQGAIVGYASLLPLPKPLIDRYIRDEIEAEQITGDDIEAFTPGKPLHLYIMAIGIDPAYPVREKHEYGAALVRGMFAFFFDLAERGVEIATITARSHKPDGLRLLRKMGFPQLRSPVNGKSLFMVRVAESGFPLFMRYSDILAEWKHSQAPTPRKSSPRPLQTQPGHSTMPSDLVGWRAFSRLHGIGESTTQAAIESERLQVVPGEWIVGKAKVKGALDAAGRAKFYELFSNNPRFTPCAECPHLLAGVS